ncbi:MAG TPA: SAM-dependent chlorinase/fluorinase [Solirubrobacteraceae bacterium]|nr:SAM-dependent chlorinase/fluorinase [Solirubrobacteraceae bacterium]
MSYPVITFLSDYGLSDHFVGVCHGTMARICPQARIIDVTHGIARHDVRAGALALAAGIPFMPRGVHLAVVDPAVGGQRRAVALATPDGRQFVGPDNGLLMGIAEWCGGAVEVVEITHTRFRLEPVSATFHGRDLFAPVAAQLAAGVTLAEVGAPLDPAELIALELPRAWTEGETIVAHAMYVDRFGNVGLNIGHGSLAEAGLKLGQRVFLVAGAGQYEAQYARTFADVAPGELLVYEDAERRLAVALSSGDAARALALQAGDELRVRPA